MKDLKLYSVSDKYVAFLRKDPRLENIFDNKEGARNHTRKYLGAVIQKNGLNYYIPLSSSKESDYFYGTDTIRKSIVPIIRITSVNSTTNKQELKGTLRPSKMIPVPKSELERYDLNAEKNLKYKDFVSKQISFIRSNQKLIHNYANVIYNQKSNESTYKINYLKSTVDFKYAEQKCREFFLSKQNELTNLSSPSASNAKIQNPIREYCQQKHGSNSESKNNDRER